jgi:hypothetical protein
MFGVAFALVCFEVKYAPDYFVQLKYLGQLDEQYRVLSESLKNNSFMLDYVFWELHRITGLELGVTLMGCYVVVFVIKYIVLFKFVRDRLYVLMIFLWGFYSLDVNQLRLNIALLFFVWLCLGGNKIVCVIVMSVSHLAATLLLPIAAMEEMERHGRRVICLAVVLCMVVAYAVLSLEVTLDERFLTYLDTADVWFPKALIACPAVLFVNRGEGNRLSRVVFGVMALLPVVVASLQFALVAARFMEIIYMAFLVKVALSDRPMSNRKRLILAVPAVLMFAFRTAFGIHTGL